MIRILILAALAVVPWTEARAAGGTGGQPFELNCGADEVLVGVEGTTGWYVDEFMILCTKLNADGSWQSDPVFRGATGEPGVAAYSLICDEGEVITAIAGTAGIYVDSFAIGCVPQGGEQGAFTELVGGAGGQEYNHACDDSGEVLVGLKGRSDWWIDQVDVVCAPKPIAPLSAVNLLAPAANAVAASPTPTFTWQPVPEGALGVQYQFCFGAAGGDPCATQLQTLETTAVPAEALAFGGEPWGLWQVRGCNTGGCSAFAQRWLAAPSAEPEDPVVNIAAPLCEVYKDDRCASCHGGFAHNEGANCTGCHNQAIHPDTGQAVWALAPVDQPFADPTTCGEICRTIRDWAEDHVDDPSGHDFLWHIQNDPLVGWGFDPELPNGSAVNPVQEMDQAAYVDLSTRWYRAGMPCDPVDDVFGPLTQVGAAGPVGGGSVPPRPPREFPRPPKVQPPKVEPVWWLDVPDNRPDRSKLDPQKGLPPECRPPIGRPQPVTLPDLRRQLDQLDDVKRRAAVAELTRLCKKLMADRRR